VPVSVRSASVLQRIPHFRAPYGDRSQTVTAAGRIIPESRAQGRRFTLPARRG